MKVIHTFVDNDGATHFDEFETDIPFDMHSTPTTAHVLLMMRSNARRIAELWKECDDCTGQRKLYVGCPQQGMRKLGGWKEAKDCVRALVFENYPGALGGIRAATQTDYGNARVLALAKDAHRDVIEAQREAGDDPAAAAQVLSAVSNAMHSRMRDIVATVSSHPLWKRMSWISDINPAQVLNIIGTFCDPTWFVDPRHPQRSGLFKERCGLYDFAESRSGNFNAYMDAYACMSMPFMSFISANGLNTVTEQRLQAPGMFFTRYALRWTQHYLNDGETTSDAISGGIFRYINKMANFVWLNWMSAIHEEFTFDADRFFFGDEEVIGLANKAAVS